MGRVGTRAAAMVLAVGTLGAVPVSADTTAPSAPVRVRVTELRDGDDRPLEEPRALNERGQVVALTPAAGPGQPTAVLWTRGQAVHVAPEGLTAGAADLSDQGQVVGWTPNHPALPWGAFSWFRGRWTELTAAGEWGLVTSVNNRGQVLGHRRLPGSQDDEVVVWDRDGRVTVAPGHGYSTAGLNDRGQALVLFSEDGGSRTSMGVWQVGGGVTPVEPLDSDVIRMSGGAINEAGHVVGSAMAADNTIRAFLWRGGEAIDLAPPYDTTLSYAYGLNERDEVVGASRTAHGHRRGWLWRDGEMVDLGTLGGNQTRPTAINDQGHVVGRSETAAGVDHAFLWRDGDMVDLGALVGPEPSSAVAINRRGQVLGAVGDGPGPPRAVLWAVR